MSVIGSNILAGASGNQGYFLTNSLRFRSSASAYLNRTPASAGSTTTWTWSGWVKRGALGAYTAPLFAYINAGATTQHYVVIDSDVLKFVQYASSTLQAQINSTAVLRDPSAWYHIVAVWNTTSATSTLTGSSTDRMRIYINGVQVSSFSASVVPTQNLAGYLNTTVNHGIGTYGTYLSSYFDGYLAEVNFIDGQALTPSSFGQTSATTGVWQPIKYTGTYGTNGFYLPFTDNSALTTSSNVGLGKDFSGNANYWTTNNISITSGSTYDSMTDVPTLTSATAANYAVLNPLSLGSSVTLFNGNLTMAEGGSYATTTSSIAMTSGKWYAEMTVGSDTYAGTVGIAKLGYAPTSRLGFQANTWSYNNDGGLYYNSSTLAVVSSYTTGDVIGIAFDADNLTIAFYKNNTLQGTQYTSANSGLTAGQFYFATGHINSTSNWNFGQRPFAYTPPSGFVALNTFNLPTPTIGATASTQANKYMDVLTWTGDGSTSTRDITGLNFQPDFVWIKQRSATISHTLYDVIRGVGANKSLASNNTDSESGTNADSVYGYLSSLNSNGISVVRGSDGTISYTNLNNGTYVGWQWKANGSGSSNTQGSITSTVSANTSAGFSIVTYTGTGANATVGHGLGVAPKMVIVKQRGSSGTAWYCYHSSLPSASYAIYLNLTNAQDGPITAFWNNTAPTSSVFTVGTSSGVNGSSGTYVAYCFAQIAGYSAFGSYTGNGSTDGTFVYTGFRPKFVLIKRSSGVDSWTIQDTSRSTYNLMQAQLLPNTSDAEDTTANNQLDTLSNGFKLRSTNTRTNQSSETYIYMAFAENPFKYANAR